MKPQRSDTLQWSKNALFATIFIMTGSAQVFAQNPNDFSNLQKYINKQVTVDTPEGQVIGQLLRVEENRLVVYEAGSPKPIPREWVKKVTRHKSRHTAAWVGGMTAAGVGAGFLIGLRAFDDATYANRKITTTTLAGAGGGAAVGYALSRVGKRDEVVYQSE